MKKYVLGFMFDHTESLVLLIRKQKPSWQAGLLNGVGGKIEPEEGPAAAMVRETEEETGIVTGSGDWTRFFQFDHIVAGDQSRVFCYSAVIPLVTGITLPILSDEGPVDLYPIHQFHKLSIMPNLAWMVPLALDRTRSQYSNIHITESR